MSAFLRHGPDNPHPLSTRSTALMWEGNYNEYGKRRLRKVFDLYVDLNLSFIDAYHAVLMRHLRLDCIVSFDKGFDRVPGVTRMEPDEG